MSRLGLSTSNSPTSLPAISVLSSSDSFSAESDNERSGDEPTSAQILQNIEDILEGSGSSSSKEIGWQAARIKTKRKRSSAPRPVVSNPIVEVSEPNTPSTSPPSNAGALLMQARAANGPATLSPTSFHDSKWQSYSRQQRARSKSIGNIVDQTNLKIEGFATLALTPAKSIVRLILSRLDLTTITACLQVCRMWANLQTDKTFWNMVYKHYEVRLKQRGEKNVNIWEASIEDKTIVEDKDGNIKFATLNGLVEKLTPAEHIPNTSDADALLTTYPTFTTAQQLVRKLFERYNVPPPANNKNLDDYAKNFVKPIQVRVCHILKKFVMWKYATLDGNLINLLKVVSKLMEDRLGVTLKYTIIKESMKLAEQRTTPRVSIAPKPAAPTTKPAKTGVKLLQPVKEKNGLLLHTNSELLAKQMTLIEFETYAVIQAQELIGESWNKKNKDQLSPNIRKMIDRFNYTTKSIVTLLLQEEKLKTRAKLFVKFIKIAAALRKINNFHTLMAVLSGLNDGPIFRLKATKEQISPKWMKVWEELQSLMSHEGSYANYRHALSAAQPPCIPYIGIYLRDLVYIESNNAPEEVKVPDGIQFKQKKQVFSVIKLLQTYQEHPYAFEPNDELIQMLNTLPTVSDDELFTLSREREPKTNQPGSRESTAPGMTVKPKTSGEPSRRTLNVQ